MAKKMNSDTNALNWFEISVHDMERAKQFYESIFRIEMIPVEVEGIRMAMFPVDGSGGRVGGALVQSDIHSPGPLGTIIYLNANPDLQHVLHLVEKAGGSINMPKVLIDEKTGYMAIITDSEGNTIGLHSNE